MMTHHDLYTFCPNCGHRLEARDNFKSCPACGKHYFFEAKIGACIMVMNDSNEVLLIKRRDDPFKDWWAIPGGFVDAGETLEQAARRELMEEAGISVDQLTYVSSINHDYVYQDVIYNVTVPIFVGKLPKGAKVKIGEEATAAGFFSKETIPLERIAFDNLRQFIKDHFKI